MRFRVRRNPEAAAQLAALAPGPKRRVREVLRELERDPYGPDTRRLRTQRTRFRVRTDGYRIIFEPGPSEREITITRIALREVAYEGIEFEPPADWRTA